MSYNMDEPCELYAKLNSQSQKMNSVCIHLYEVYRIVKSQKQKLEWWLPESRGEENGELLFSEYKSLSFVR
jgi:hypothetical protein